MKNVISWTHQVTVDYSYNVGRDLEHIAKNWGDRGMFAEHSDFLKGVAEAGLSRDENRRVTDLRELQAAKSDLDKKRRLKPDVNIGGNPAISAIRGYYLNQRAADSSLPAVAYVGLYPKSLARYIDELGSAKIKNVLGAVFRGRIRIDDEPQSLALEAGKKLIFAYGEGRTADLLFQGTNFKKYVEEIRQQIEPFKHGTAVLAIGVPFPLQDGVRLLRALI